MPSRMSYGRVLPPRATRRAIYRRRVPVPLEDGVGVEHHDTHERAVIAQHGHLLRRLHHGVLLHLVHKRRASSITPAHCRPPAPDGGRLGSHAPRVWYVPTTDRVLPPCAERRALQRERAQVIRTHSPLAVEKHGPDVRDASDHSRGTVHTRRRHTVRERQGTPTVRGRLRLDAQGGGWRRAQGRGPPPLVYGARVQSHHKGGAGGAMRYVIISPARSPSPRPNPYIHTSTLRPTRACAWMPMVQFPHSVPPHAPSWVQVCLQATPARASIVAGRCSRERWVAPPQSVPARCPSGA